MCLTADRWLAPSSEKKLRGPLSARPTPGDGNSSTVSVFGKERPRLSNLSRRIPPEESFAASCKALELDFYKSHEEKLHRLTPGPAQLLRQWSVSSFKNYKCSISRLPHFSFKYSATRRRWQLCGLSSLQSRHPPSKRERSRFSILRRAIRSRNRCS